MLRVVSFGFTCSAETQNRTRHTIYIEDADQAVSRLRQNGRNGESGDRVKVAVPGPWLKLQQKQRSCWFAASH